jgi:seryl-tRNA synthetase
VRFYNLLNACTVLTTDTVTGTAPWVTRVNHIKAATAVNHEAEHKLTRVNEEMQSLARSLRVKDQSIQETGVKIELMERRLEASRKQADMISELEGEIAKARKQESAYEEAMEQLQSDLDTLEKDNAKLKASVAANPVRQGKLRLFLRFFFLPHWGSCCAKSHVLFSRSSETRSGSYCYRRQSGDIISRRTGI